MALLNKYAISSGMENNLETVSLGKGQGPRAEQVIKVRRAAVRLAHLRLEPQKLAILSSLSC